MPVRASGADRLGARWSAQAAISQLRAGNAILELENASFRAATGELAGQIASLQNAVDEIGAGAAVDPDADRAMSRLPERVRARAMGGGSGLAASVLSGAIGSPDNPFGILRDHVGSTGRSTSSHLHYEVLVNGQLTNPMRLLSGR